MDKRAKELFKDEKELHFYEWLVISKGINSENFKEHEHEWNDLWAEFSLLYDNMK